MPDRRGYYYFPFWHTMAFTGMRRGEGCGLCWHAVDLDRASLYVTRTLTTIDKPT